jgi:polyisoprenoid-binding protein YceI
VPERSSVTIEGRTNLHPVHAEATGVEGHLEAEVGDGALDLSVPPRARIELAVDRIRSGNALFEREMHRRVEARKFPTIVGELRTVEEVGPGRYRARGDLTFHGVTREVEGEVTVTVSQDHAVEVRGRQAFDIRDFGLEAPRLLLLRAEPEVTVEVHLVGVREP